MRVTYHSARCATYCTTESTIQGLHFGTSSILYFGSLMGSKPHLIVVFIACLSWQELNDIAPTVSPTWLTAGVEAGKRVLARQKTK